MKFVVKECLSAGFASFHRGAIGLDGVLFGKLLFDFSRQRFGEDSSRAGRSEATANSQSRSTSALYRKKRRHGAQCLW
jgi:hypothetical protein